MPVRGNDQLEQDAALDAIIKRADQRGLTKELLRRLISVADAKGGYRALRAARRRRYEELSARALKEHGMLHHLMLGEERHDVRCGVDQTRCTSRHRVLRLHHRYCRELFDRLNRGPVFVLLPRQARTLNEIVGYLVDEIGLSKADVALLRARISPNAPAFAHRGSLASRERAVMTAYSEYKKACTARPPPPRLNGKAIKKPKPRLNPHRSKEGTASRIGART